MAEAEVRDDDDDDDYADEATEGEDAVVLCHPCYNKLDVLQVGGGRLLPFSWWCLVAAARKALTPLSFSARHWRRSPQQSQTTIASSHSPHRRVSSMNRCMAWGL
jgi:hypothetical protein